MTPELLGELVGMLLPVLEERIEQAVRRAARPVQAQAEYIAHRYGISARTVQRKCRQLGIPARDMHGQIKPGSDGPTLYNLDEWELATKLHPKTIKSLRRGG